MTLDTTKNIIQKVVKNMPNDWLRLTTHRLDIYNEKKAKSEFLEEFENLVIENKIDRELLKDLPTAYDYIRLGHPLSCLLEWTYGQANGISSNQVISFSSSVAPLLAILRKNALIGRETTIHLPKSEMNAIDFKKLKEVYNYSFQLVEFEGNSAIKKGDSNSHILYQPQDDLSELPKANVDFVINTSTGGSVVYILGDNQEYISEIQHVRRRETIAMTPANCLQNLKSFLGEAHNQTTDLAQDKKAVYDCVQEINGVKSEVIVGSSGLSVQYAIMMGLVDYAQEKWRDKPICFVVPPNCYGGTNDQARRVAAVLPNVEIVDLPVDGENDMVSSLQTVLKDIAKRDAVPYIIAEIPTNPRVEVPDLKALKATLGTKRITADGKSAIEPVFILDQTFCPNVQFLTDESVFSDIKAISYASGSKFPSGGKCTAGYALANTNGQDLMNKVVEHLAICDNEATTQQYEVLAEQLPSMLDRIQKAYDNTREFVDFIEEVLPTSKINFVSQELVDQGFTPSVFSLDLPTKGDTDEEREAYKRALNHRLINLMITEIPNESKYCVSYGQLKGCYWTIPATSTQGTTKEGDKDYIARVALSGDMDLDKHKEVFKEFVNGL